MARTDNFTNFATDVADSIREKTGETGLIPASEFDTRIKSIETNGDLIEKVIFDDGEYLAIDDNADGYSKIDSQVLTVKNRLYLIKDGIEQTENTGGHTFYKMTGDYTGSEIQGDGFIGLTCRRWSAMNWKTNNAFDPKKYKKLYIEYDFPNKPTDSSFSDNCAFVLGITGETSKDIFRRYQVVPRTVMEHIISTEQEEFNINLQVWNLTGLSSYKNYPVRIYNMWLQEEVSMLENKRVEILENGLINVPLSSGFKGFKDVIVNTAIGDTFPEKINYMQLYSKGDEFIDITGGFKTGYIGSNTSYSSLSINVDNMTIQTNGYGNGVSTYRTVTTTNSITLQNYSKMIIGLTIEKPNNANEYFMHRGICATDTTNIMTSNANVLKAAAMTGYSTIDNFTGFITMDISGLEEGYPALGLQSNTASLHKNIIHEWFLVKDDSWQTLCAMNNIDFTLYENEAALCSDLVAMESILNNDRSRNYLINQCTGSFMVECLNDSTILNLIQNHEYYYEFVKNENWKLFLQMYGANVDIEIPVIPNPDDLSEELNVYKTEVTEQKVSIDTIIEALEGKAAGSTSVQSGINVFVQEDEPETKDGIWVQTTKSFDSIDFLNVAELFHWAIAQNDDTVIPYVREIGVTSVGTNVYIAGGMTYNTTYKNTMYKYDTLSNTYTKLTNLPYSAYGISMISYETDIYIFGGRNSGTTCYNYAYKYDTLTDTYTKLTNMPASIGQTGIARVGTDIYIVGGTINGGGQGDGFYKYDILTDSYITLPALPVNRNCPLVCSYGTDVYIFCGFNGTILQDAYKYDTLTNTYTKLADYPIPVYSGAAQPYYDCIYIFGGIDSNNNTATDKTYLYDPKTDTYTAHAKLWAEKGIGRLCGSTKVGKDIYFPGGMWTVSGTESGFLGTLTRCDTDYILADYVSDTDKILLYISPLFSPHSIKLAEVSNAACMANIISAYYYSVEDGIDYSIATYIGNGTEWVKIN